MIFVWPYAIGDENHDRIISLIYRAFCKILSLPYIQSLDQLPKIGDCFFAN